MTNQKPTAEDTYARLRFAAIEAAERALFLLGDLPAPDTRPPNWGRVGDVGRVLELIEAANDVLCPPKN